MTSSQSPGRVLDPPDDDFFPDDWKLYQRMADCGHDLALDLKSLLEEKKFKEAYQLLAAEHVLVAGHILDEFCHEISIDELNRLAPAVVHVSLRRITELRKRPEREQMSAGVSSIVRRMSAESLDHITFSLAHAKKSAKGSEKLISQTEVKHNRVRLRASALRKLNPRLSNNSIATFLINQNQTEYKRSTLLRILKNSEETGLWA